MKRICMKRLENVHNADFFKKEVRLRTKDYIKIKRNDFQNQILKIITLL